MTEERKIQVPQDNPAPQVTSPLQNKYAVYAAIASVSTVIILILIKAVAYWYSNSTSVLASLIDSLVDCGISIMTLFAVQYSIKPPDHEHRYGHGKIEGVMALLQSVFIGAAAILLVVESLSRFSKPPEIENYTLVFVVMSVSVVLSIVLVMIQKYTLRMAPSLAIKADQAHYSMDVVTNIGVICVLVALLNGAPVWIDSVFAIAMAIYISFTVKAIFQDGLDMLLDRELPQDTRDKIITIIKAHNDVMGMHDLRTRKSGMKIIIAFDLEVDADLSLQSAHDIARDIEVNLFQEFPNAEIFIHVDPHNDTEDTRHTVAGVHHS